MKERVNVEMKGEESGCRTREDGEFVLKGTRKLRIRVQNAVCRRLNEYEGPEREGKYRGCINKLRTNRQTDRHIEE